ncbi:MAG: M48 family metallopeptidase, partial [Candidatus Aenigmatarchaeota archaeon]
SCTKNKDLLYNWRVIMAPMSIVDYVVVHELCHLKEKNHTDKFWRMLKSVIPDYEDRKEWLRVNGPRLVF